MKKIKALLIASFLIITIAGTCFSANAAIQVVNKVQQPQQPQHGSEGTIAGMIYDKYANPVDNAIVMLFPAGKFLPEIVSSKDGAYSFTDVPSGQYRIVATKPLINGSGSTTVFTLNEGSTILRNVYLTHGFGGSGGNYSGENGTVAGTIYDENGNPADESYVLLFGKGKILPYNYSISAEDGSYGFVNNVPPGQYRIIATKPLIDGSGSTTLFVVSPGATTTIDVYLNNFLGGGQEIMGQQKLLLKK